MTNYEPTKMEEEILEFWSKNKTYEKVVEKNKNGKKFYYLDGPPYTTGAIHIGHAWGKALRDSIMRFKRMQGFNVWDRPGFDMHGLPIEVSVEKKLGITDKKQIVNELGLSNFIKECKNFALEQMYPMIKDFKRIGVWMDWDNPYMTITNDYIEGAWWALKRAGERKLLYEGLKTMTWCPRCATALAKHELEYKTVTEKSVFVKFPLLDENEKPTNTYLIIWTTTPWTLPFNLAVMVHPDFEYVKVKISDSDEYWIVAKALVNALLGIVGKKYEIVEEFKGEKLDGLRYKPPFWDEVPQAKELFKENKRAFSVVLSSEYVDISSGSGLVHSAPGCGPEDYEVGLRYGLPAFNLLDETGTFPEEIPEFKGLKAKKDDNYFIKKLDEKGILVTTSDVEHEYAHCWRCKTPVIYRATKQWFLAVSKLKDEMISENEKITWVPDWAGNKWFKSWLENLQDWCISRQRFWGIPLPIWKCEKCGHIELIGSKKELEEKSGKKVDDLHRPWIDEVTIKCPKCGAEMHRVPDVLDVWLDSGAASWATIGFPSKKELFEELWPADLILEGKDQIRGWFNSLMCLSFVSHGKPPFKAVYMHGFINDSQGRKMSKSLKNIISPYEVIEKYGADAMRFYMIGGTNPGLDLNYNFDDMREKYRNLNVLWNIHKYLLDLIETHNIKAEEIINIEDFENEFDNEEKYIISRMNSAIKDITEKFENYKLNETPSIVESLFLDLSRDYIKFTRNKAMKKPKLVSAVILKVLLETLKIMAPITPFITERIFLNLREKLGDKVIKEESVHLCEWPAYEETAINKELEEEFNILDSIMQAALSIRDKTRYGVRWPLKSLLVITKEENIEKAVNDLSSIIKEQLNVKEVRVSKDIEMEEKVKLNFKTLGEKYKQEIAGIVASVSQVKPSIILEHIRKEGKYKLKVNNKTIELTMEDVIVEKQLPKGFVGEETNKALVVLDTNITQDLLIEGFARELIRRIQNLRKKNSLKKTQKVRVEIGSDDNELLRQILGSYGDQIIEKTGSEGIIMTEELDNSFSEEKVKDKTFWIKINVL